MKLLVAALVGLLVGSARGGAQQASASDSLLPFSCATFPSGLSEVDLRSRFGDNHVATAPVPWGGAEGDYNEGTVLFAGTSGAKAEVYWRDKTGKRLPEWVSVRGKQSRWRTSRGITGQL